MSILYETYSRPRRLQVERKRYRIDFDLKIHEGTTTGRGTITWNPDKTQIVAASLQAVGDLVLGGATPLTAVRGSVSFIVNGIVDGEHLSDVCFIGECHNPFSLLYPVKGLVQNGENEVKIEIRKSFGWPTWIEVRNFSCYIVIDFEGESPEVDIGPPPSAGEIALGYVKWGIAGAIGLGVLYIGTKAIAEWRRKK